MILSDHIDKKGYVILRNVIPLEEIIKARKNITSDKVLYKNLEYYIDNVIIEAVYDKLDIGLVCSKYRVSNKNNSNDAAAYHRDIQIHTDNYDKNIEIYTVLNYLDGGNMKLIPGSHEYPHMGIRQMVDFYGKGKELILGPTDILIFRSTVLHKGLFYFPQDNRRLIQCFDCIPSNKFEELNSQILHTPCISKCYTKFENMMILLSKNIVFINLLDIINFYNVAGGYGYKEYGVLKRLYGDKYKYISTEANNHRINKSKMKEGWGKLNVYVNRFELNDWKVESESMIKFYTVILSSSIILAIVFMLVCLVIGLVLYKLMN